MDHLHIEARPEKVALVTGSSSGIGSFIAKDLAKSGQYTVIFTGRNKQALGALTEQIENSVAFPADLLCLDQVDDLINFVRTEYGRLDLLVNNACWRGLTKSLLDDESSRDIDEIMHINLLMPLYLIRKCLIPLRPSNGDLATVINITSGASQIVVPLHLYSITKACLSELSKEISKFSDELGILSIAIGPGPVLTTERPHHIEMSKLTLVRRVGEPDEISNFVMFVIQRAPYFNGRELFIDGGYIAKCNK